MDWFARSIANSLKLQDDGDENDNGIIKTDNPNTTTTTTTTTSSSTTSDPKSPGKQNLGEDQHRPINSQSESSLPSSTSTPRGVKEDLSELTKSLTRQLWGVASFLAPPPSDQPKPAEPSDQSKTRELSDPEASDEALIAGIRSDFAEIGGKFKSGISRLSSNIAVSEITKIASNFLQIGPEQDTIDQDLVGNAVGVTEEVLAFSRNIAMHPETWLDFPVPDDEDFDDFDMSDAQQEHALAVERFAPSLPSLRIELCPGYMSEGCFWKIYFILLHPRLNKHDAELLSTTQITETRAMLMPELNNQTKAKTEADWSGIDSYSKESTGSPHEEHLSDSSSTQFESAPIKKSIVEVAPSTMAADFETEKDQVRSTEVQIVEKSAIEEEPVKQATTEHSQSSSSRVLDDNYEDDGDDWLKEESSEIVGVSGSKMPLGNDDDVSFSDLEDDDGNVATSYKKVTYGSDSSTKDSRDWVQLSSSSSDSVKDNNSAGIKQVGSGQVSALSAETKESNDWLDVDDIDVM